jgi:hypothetical protein
VECDEEYAGEQIINNKKNNWRRNQQQLRVILVWTMGHRKMVLIRILKPSYQYPTLV